MNGLQEFFYWIFELVKYFFLAFWPIILVGIIIFIIVSFFDSSFIDTIKKKQIDRKRKAYWKQLPDTYKNKSRKTLQNIHDYLTNISKLESCMPNLDKNNRSSNMDDLIKGMADIMIYEQNSDKILEYQKQVCLILGSFPQFPDLDIKYIDSILSK